MATLCTKAAIFAQKLICQISVGARRQKNLRS